MRNDAASDYGANPQDYRPSGSSPLAYRAPEKRSQIWDLRKVFAVILVLAILLPIIVYALSGLTLPGLQPTTPTGGFIWIGYIDNRTVQVIFDDFYPETRYNDIAFRLTMGGWTSSSEGVAGGQTYYINSHDYFAEVFFNDLEMDGIIEAGDYCTIYSPDVPVGTQCILDIYFEPTGENVCSAWFSFL